VVAATVATSGHRSYPDSDDGHKEVVGMRKILIVLAALALIGLTPPASASAVLRQVTGFGSNPGALQMFEYVPDGLPPGRPVVVALHGCTQDATYGQGAGWTELADRWKFAVVLPQQVSANNLSKCFNWFQSTDTTRGSGEAESIAQMARRGAADTGGDARRVYVTGLSAGGGMTSVMLAAYPELFAGGGIVAGLPYGCATTILDAFTCMNPGRDLTPRQWGDKVRAASSYTGARPGMSIWQGSADFTVAPMNLREITEQWTDVGAPVETHLINGMGHGQPVAPGSGDGHCGHAGPYLLDVGVCAAWQIGLFWNLPA
jgi:poly(hydroxyalkanoate) depolymerase family esterase